MYRRLVASSIHIHSTPKNSDNTVMSRSVAFLGYLASGTRADGLVELKFLGGAGVMLYGTFGADWQAYHLKLKPSMWRSSCRAMSTSYFAGSRCITL